MGRWAYTYADEFDRLINGRWYEGVAFFGTSRRAKDVARVVRDVYGISCRMVKIKRSSTHRDRFLVMVPIDRDDPEYDDARAWIKKQEGAWQ